MWVVNFVVVRDGERSPEDGSPRFMDTSAPFPVPDIDQSVVHRGEMFVVDDVVWDLERKTVFVEITPVEDEDAPAPTGDVEIEIDDAESDDAEYDDAEYDDAESDDAESDSESDGPPAGDGPEEGR